MERCCWAGRTHKIQAARIRHLDRVSQSDGAIRTQLWGPGELWSRATRASAYMTAHSPFFWLLKAPPLRDRKEQQLFNLTPEANPTRRRRPARYFPWVGIYDCYYHGGTSLTAQAGSKDLGREQAGR